MKAFKPALFDGSDPSYSPCISWAGKYPSWRAPKRYIENGYKFTQLKLEPGSRDDEHQLGRARKCRELTRAMVEWWEAKDESRLDFGTWAYLIARYRTDEFSPYKEVKANTRESYDGLLNRWQTIIGHLKIEAMTYEQVKRIEARMKEKGRTASNIKRMFTMLRTVAKYGVLIGNDQAATVSLMLSNVRFRNAAQRSVAPTREQIYQIVEQADEEGDKHFAIGIIMQFELNLRAVDVRGQWLEDDGEQGLVRNGKRWQDGLTWDMFDPDLLGFTKVISKTAKSLPEPYHFDLSNLPELRARIHEVRPELLVGPVIVTSRHGLPYDRHAWANKFRTLRRAVGLPDEIKSMDARAGGITEAKTFGVQPNLLRDSAQHKQASTTDRYSRGRSDAANKVIEIRQKNK